MLHASKYVLLQQVWTWLVARREAAMVLIERFLRLLVRCLDAVGRKLSRREAGLSLLMLALLYLTGMRGKHL